MDYTVYSQNVTTKQMPKKVIAAQKKLMKNYLVIYKRFSGYRNTKNKNCISEIQFFAKLKHIDFREIKQLAFDFIGVNE